MSLAQSDQEGAIECVRVREKDGGRGRESERRWRSWMCTIGLDMNAPQHSFPHIPFNFNSLIELATLLHPLRGEAFSLTHPCVCASGLHLHRKTTVNEQTCKKKTSLIRRQHLRRAAASSAVNSAPVRKMAAIKFALPRLCGCKYDKVFKSGRLTLLSIHQSLLASPSEAVGVCRQS